MSDKEIYEQIKDYFIIQEFVSPKVYNKHGEDSWKFICPRLLHTLLVIRKVIDKPITINNWHIGGKFKQRGLRSNLGYIFYSQFKKRRMYLSAHVMGRAVDFDVEGMKAEEVRNWLILNKKILPYKIRLEHKKGGKYISWVHLDMFSELKNPLVYRFNI